MPKYQIAITDLNRSTDPRTTGPMEFDSIDEARAYAEKVRRHEARLGRRVSVEVYRVRPKPKLRVEWGKDGKLNVYPASGGKKLITITYMPAIHKDHHDALAPFMQGWFDSNDPSDWNYRVVVR